MITDTEAQEIADTILERGNIEAWAMFPFVLVREAIMEWEARKVSITQEQEG